MNLNLLKTMKKTILIMAAIFTATLFSCSSDDDGGKATVVDPIIGKWNLDRFTIDGVEQTLTDCDKESFYRFETERFEIFISEQEGSACDQYTEGFGSWMKNSGNALRYDGVFTSNNETEEYVFELNEAGTELQDIIVRDLGDGTTETRIFFHVKE